MVGGFGEVKPATEEIQLLVKGLEASIKESLENECEKIEAHSFTQQVVAGMNYKIKVDCGNEFIHVKVFQPLPHENAGPQLVSCTKGHTLETPL